MITVLTALIMQNPDNVIVCTSGGSDAEGYSGAIWHTRDAEMRAPRLLISSDASFPTKEAAQAKMEEILEQVRALPPEQVLMLPPVQP